MNSTQSAGSDTKSPLCSQCQKIDFKAIFRSRIITTTAQGPETFIVLGWLDDIGRRTTCSFCRLVRQTLQFHFKDSDLTPLHWKEGKPDSKRLKCFLYNDELARPEADGIDGKGSEGSSLFYLEISTSPALYRRDLYSWSGRINQNWLLPKIQLISDKSSEKKLPSGHGRIVPAKNVNFTLLNRWLSLCNHLHPELSQDTFSSPAEVFSHLRVIDVNRQCIIDAPKDCMYLALSYVWGQGKVLTLSRENRIALGREGGLESAMDLLPLTIRDAILLAKELHIPYVWVDSLCIIQNDEEDQRRQIGAMNHIYRSAVLTAVAAWGQDAQAGLPGVRVNSRLARQAVEEVQGLILANLLPGWRESVDLTPWNQRGWTYQEKLLANRIMIFTAEQVYFSCKHGCNFREESGNDDLSKADFTSIPSSQRTYSLDLRYQVNFKTYAMVVNEYSRRSLSYSTDGLNAISAILSTLEKPFRGAFLYGLPETAIDAALLWKPAARSHRRCDPVTRKSLFPSWSWVGWENEVEYDDCPNLCEVTRSKIVWFSSFQTDGVCSGLISESCGKPPAHWPGWKNWERRVDDDDDEIYYVEIGGDPAEWFCHPILPREERPSVSPMEAGSGILQFYALSAFFEVTNQHAPLPASWFYNSCKSYEHIICHLSVFNQKGDRAGAVLIDSNMFNERGPGKYEFVVISQTTRFPSTVDPSWDSSTQTFLPSRADRKVAREPEESDSDEEEDQKEVFDPRCYDNKKYWCLFNVLMIERRDGIAYRLGIGKLHIDAFDEHSPKKLIVLG